MCPEQKGKLKVSTQMTIKIAIGGDCLRCPKTMLKYPPRGSTGNFHAVQKRFESNSGARDDHWKECWPQTRGKLKVRQNFADSAVPHFP